MDEREGRLLDGGERSSGMKLAIRKIGNGWQVYSVSSRWKSSVTWATFEQAQGHLLTVERSSKGDADET